MIEVQPAINRTRARSATRRSAPRSDGAARPWRRLKNGEAWEVVAKTASDSALAPQAGDLGLLAKESGYDEPFMEAIFAAAIRRADRHRRGQGRHVPDRAVHRARHRRGRPDFQAAISEAGIKLADYRVAVRGDVLRTKLRTRSSPTCRRPARSASPPDPASGAQHLDHRDRAGDQGPLDRFAPNDSMTSAADLRRRPGVDEGQGRRRRALALLKAAPPGSTSSPGRVRRGERQEQRRQAAVDLPDPRRSTRRSRTSSSPNTDPPGTILAPVKGEDAWFVIQIMRRSTDGEDAWLKDLKAKATDDATFKQLARDNSEGEGAKDGGDIGWITRGQLADAQDKAIFETAIGANSDVVEVSGDALYLFRILAEETREPTQEQLDIIKSSGFSYWYTREKEKADIQYPLGTGTTTG